MNLRHPTGVLHSFSLKNIFYDKMDWKHFYFYVTIYFQNIGVLWQIHPYLTFPGLLT